MAAKKISQREAHRLQKRVQELLNLEHERNYRWAREYPGGVHILSLALSPIDAAKITVIKQLDHAIVGTFWNNGELNIYAVKP